MKVYVLGSGRCGEKTLASACSYMTNYSVGTDLANDENEIVIDKQLIWSVDELDDGAMFVHLIGDHDYTADGYRRFGFDELTVSRWSPLLNGKISERPGESDASACLEYVSSINAKISTSLSTRPHKMTIDTSELKEGFETLWNAMGAKGNLDKALDLFRLHAELADYLPLLPEAEEATT